MKLIVDLTNSEEVANAMVLLSSTVTAEAEAAPEPVVEVAPVEQPEAEAEAPPLVDKHGRAHDPRIDSERNRSLTSDGEWRSRRKPKDMNTSEWVAYRDAIINNSDTTPEPELDVVASLFDEPTPEPEPEPTVRVFSGDECQNLLMDRIMSPDYVDVTVASVTEACNKLGYATLMEAVKNADAVAQLAELFGL